MRTTTFRLISLAGLLLAAACDSSTDDVGANPSAGSGGTGVAGSNQAGGGQGPGGSSNQAGATQAGAGGAAAGTGGGAGSGGQPVPFEQKRSPKPRADGSAVSEADRQAVVDGNNAFGFDLYQQLRSDAAQSKKNLWFSPLSMTLALGMTSSGAVGQTQSDIHKAMHFTLPDAQLHPALNWLSLELAKRPQQAIDYAKNGGSTTVPDVALNVVNAVWGEKTLTWRDPFLDVLAQSYGTGINLGNFKSNPEQERLVINQWVADQTQQRITDLLGSDAVTTDTRLVLVNAVNFTFAWSLPFSPENTKAAPFTVEGGATTSVPTMARSITTSYAEDTLAQSVSLPLFSGSLSVVVYVPKAGQFAAFEANLAAEVASLDSAAEQRDVDLTLPRFKFTTPTVTMTPYLKNLGMNAPFNQADFSTMSTTEPLYISSVAHKAMLGIDEVGVQAAAATAVILDGGSSPPVPATLHVDRSFLVGIRDNATGAFLFFGRILDPTQG